MVAAYLSLLSVLALARLVELAVSRRHLSWALSRGGVEFGRDHFFWMKILHATFFLASASEVVFLERPFVPALGLPMLLLVVLAQGLRYWAILSLGKRWNVRVVVLPGDQAISSGPYRFVRHPNYLAVIVEFFAIPLVHTAWLTALVFSTLNAWMLRVRIRCEEGALLEHSSYSELLADRGRFIP